jgi:RNA polymerase sigma-70 factor (ECF subfamily)
MDDRSDFARVYEENVWRVYALVAYRVRDPHLAEDLTQATFERALRAWGRFDPRRGSEQAWLLRIAHNLIIDHARRSPPASVELEERLEPRAAYSDARFTGSAELIELIGRLPDRDQEVIALRFGGDLSTAEIGHLLELSAANVQQIISRALRKLRAWLQNEPVA